MYAQLEPQFVDLHVQVVAQHFPLANLCIFKSLYNLYIFLVFVSTTDLEVHVLNTEMDLQDLSFPQNYASDSTIHLSASTIKQYSRNGQQPLLLPVLTHTAEKLHCSVQPTCLCFHLHFHAGLKQSSYS